MVIPLMAMAIPLMIMMLISDWYKEIRVGYEYSYEEVRSDLFCTDLYLFACANECKGV